MTGAPAEYRGLIGQMTSDEICLQARQGGKQTILPFSKARTRCQRLWHTFEVAVSGRFGLQQLSDLHLID